MSRELPEVIRLRDTRGGRPENAAGIGEFWYEPEVWALPLSPDARVLYAGLCSFLGNREINRKDLRNTLKDRPDKEISRALEELVHHDLIVPAGNAEDDASRGYEVRPVSDFSV